MKFIHTIPFTPLLIGLLIGGALGAALGYYGQCTSGMCPLTSTWWRGMLYGAFLGGLFAFSSGRSRDLPRTPTPENSQAGAQSRHEP